MVPKHPHLVSGRPHGEPLARRLLRSRLTLAETTSVIDQATRGLDTIHRLGRIHGRLSTHHVLIGREGYRNDLVKIRVDDTSVGDPRYDVFALGTILDACLADPPPAVRAVIARATASHPDDRPASALALRDELFAATRR